MPWFPEFASAAQLAREEVRADGLADPVGEFLAALREGDPRILEAVWPGEIVIYDPRAGEVRGHKQVREFISRNLSWLAGLHARAETVAATRSAGRAVVELLARHGSRGPGAGVAAGGRGRVRRRPVGGLPHLLQPVAGRRAAAPQARPSSGPPSGPGRSGRAMSSTAT